MTPLRLREELELLPGAALADGQPTWMLHDPSRHRFFSIDWITFEILRRWSFAEAETIVESVNADTTLELEPADVERVRHFLLENELVQPGDWASARELAARESRMRGTWFKRLLHHYLFFRIPLARPDAWLGRWERAAGFFYTPPFLLATMLALLAGLTQIVRQWDGFRTSLVDTFNWQGLLQYGLALVACKLLHELGHAFTAKRYGCRVPAMGVAFMVLWPVAYTDANDAWRITRRWRRLHVSAAGILTELAIAAWATLAWAVLPEGGLRGAAFVLATTSWVATLAVNASPFMRFDGYFILSDLLDLPNLHARSFALARWKLREWLFALDEEKPEHFPPRREVGLIAFAFTTWLYRLVVFTGIALLVYHFFFKALGVFLFLVEISWFIAQPVAREFGEWRARWPRIRASRRARATLLVLGLASLLLFVPWPGRVGAFGVLKPLSVWPVHAPGAALVTRFDGREGRPVAAGERFVELDSAELRARRRIVLARIERLRWQAGTSAFDARAQARLLSSESELATAQAELAAIDEEAARYAPVAPFAGRLRDIDPDLQPGTWLEDGELIGLVVGDDGTFIVETYLDEESVKRISVGDRGAFVSEGTEGPRLDLRVRTIDADATRELPDGMLSVAAGGHVITRDRDGKRVPERASYRVSLAVESPVEALDGQVWRGRVAIAARAEAPGLRYLRNALAVLVREAGW